MVRPFATQLFTPDGNLRGPGAAYPKDSNAK